MSKYIVSARKYRPMRFDEVVGQNHVSNTLKNALKTDHLGHSFLFTGPRGVGKTTSARILAKVLNCEQRTEDFEPCNQCKSCTAFNENHSFNIYELDAASNNSVENIRDLVDQVRFPPQQGEYKVYIIDEVHMLSQAAFNAFLKTLEEPPSYAIFILATTEKHKILPTILSRCQIFDFNRVQVPAIVEHLEMISKKENVNAEESALHIIAQKADGALRDALSIYDRIVSYSGDELTYQQVTESLNLLDYDTFFELTEALLVHNQNKILLHYNEIQNNGFDGDQVMLGLAEHFRNLLVAKNPDTLELMEVAPNVKQRYQEQANLAKQSFLLNALNIANHCDVTFKQAKNKRMHVELALLKICYLGQTITDVPLEEPEVKKNATPIVKPPVQANESKTEEIELETKAVKPAHTEGNNIIAEPIIENQPKEKSSVELENSTPVKKLRKPKTVKPALSFHLSQLDEEVEKRKEKAEIVKDLEENSALIDNPDVSEEEVRTAWLSIADEINSVSLSQGIQNSEIKYKEGTLDIIVHGKVIRDYLKEHHNFIVDTIQEKTGLKKFTYNIDCIDVKRNDIKSFTKEEELDYLKENNPAIKQLCDNLNLQIRYD